MIKIDYVAGTYGKFLEYVSNVYLLKTPPTAGELFTELGASHNVDQTYTHNKKIVSYPYSSHYYSMVRASVNPDDILIRIVVDKLDNELFFILLTNALIRIDDRGFDAYVSTIPRDITDSPGRHRAFWYSKIAERTTYQDMIDIYASKKFINFSVPMFEFSYESFLSFPLFVKELNQLAYFLELDFYPTPELFELWSKFINKNQGVNSLSKCNNILENIFANKPVSIDCTILEQAWINYNLSTICRIYDGSMFDDDEYPTNTQDIFKEIVQKKCQ